MLDEEEASIKIQQPEPQNVSGVFPNLPLVFCRKPEEFVISLAKATRVYSAREKYTIGFNIESSTRTSYSSKDNRDPNSQEAKVSCC